MHWSPDSIVMSDWAASKYICAAPQTFLYTLAILSLVYDHVLLLDEMLVLSAKLANWFNDPTLTRLLEELFDAGTITVLTLASERYPTAMLRDRSLTAPLQTRGRLHPAIWNVGRRPFRP